MSLTFRVAQLKDIVKINELVNSAYRGNSSPQSWTSESHLIDGARIDLKAIEELILDLNQAIILGLLDDQIVGTVVVKKNPHSAYIGMLSVQPGLQSSGLGKQLLTVAENFAINFWNADTFEMKVIKQKPELLNWYQRSGYIPSGQKIPFPYDNPSVGKPKVKDLEFVVLNKKVAARMYPRL